MKSDRELLELAAKAAGELSPYWYGRESYFDGVLDRWNPLTDDGDALRLAVKLYFDVRISEIHRDTFVYFSGGVSADEAHRKAPYAATRRAIVRAAAEIGKGME